MAVPAGGEIAMYNAAVKLVNYRLALGLDYPARTAQKQELFNGPIDPIDFWHTDVGGAPLVSGGELLLRMYGAAPREVVQTRPHWMPADTAKAFTVEFHATFPIAAPVYNNVITVGTIHSALGQVADPFRIVQRGSLHASGTDIGKLYFNTAGALPSPAGATTTLGFSPHDNASHKYTIVYDPAATNQLIIKVDDVALYTSAAAQVQPRPYFVAFGMILPSEALTAAQQLTMLNGGSKATPTALTGIKVQDLTVSGASYESRTYPLWSSANAGGTTLANSADGERVSIDGETWAKVPHTQIVDISTTQGLWRSTPFDTLTATFALPKASAPDSIQNWFLLNRLVGRPVLLDTLVSSETVTGTYKRQFVGIIDKATWDGDKLTIEARDRPGVRLDSFIARGYMDITPTVGAQQGVLTGYRSGLTIDEILEDLVNVSDAVHGGPLGATSTQIRLVDIAPQSLSSGGASLKTTFDELADRSTLEVWRKYRTSGTASYGQIVCNAFTKTGSSGYTFRGKGATGGNVNILEPGIRVTEDRRVGPGQVWYRNNAPSVAEQLLSVEEIPNLGIFPSAPYPPTDRSLNDTSDAHSKIGQSGLLTLRDASDANVTGGIAMHRYEIENLFRRTVEIPVGAHDWIEPTDLVAVDDALVSGLASTEVLLVVGRTLEIRDGVMKSRVQCVPIDFANSIKRTL